MSDSFTHKEIPIKTETLAQADKILYNVSRALEKEIISFSRETTTEINESNHYDKKCKYFITSYLKGILDNKIINKDQHNLLLLRFLNFGEDYDGVHEYYINEDGSFIVETFR